MSSFGYAWAALRVGLCFGLVPSSPSSSHVIDPRWFSVLTQARFRSSLSASEECAPSVFEGHHQIVWICVRFLTNFQSEILYAILAVIRETLRRDYRGAKTQFLLAAVIAGRFPESIVNLFLS